MGAPKMTQDNSSNATPGTESASGDLFNTAAGWVLFAAGLGLGLSILSGKFFHGDKPERPETMGYAIEVADEGGGAAEMTFAEALSLVTPEDGEKVFAKCAACHTIEQGGATGVGPNLYGVMGTTIGTHAAGYAYSSALASKGGTWGFDEMNAWLDNPRGYVDGTKMGFAGLSSIEDRAAVTLYMNSMGSNLPVPEFVPEVAEVEAVAEGDVEAVDEAEQDAAAEVSEETEAAEAAE